MSDLNDPRVFFAAERTLLAWNRTGLSLIALGFVIERFDLFLRMFSQHGAAVIERDLPFWIGLSFIALGALSSAAAVVQYRLVLKSLKPVEIPRGYGPNLGVIATLAVAALGCALIAYLFTHQQGV